jgi:hypothetical protein
VSSKSLYVRSFSRGWFRRHVLMFLLSMSWGILKMGSLYLHGGFQLDCLPWMMSQNLLILLYPY